MSLFGHFKRRRKVPRGFEEAPRANETAPGVKAMKELYDIKPKKRPERIEGEVETNIYATNRSNGIPRRKRPPHLRPRPEEPFDPPY